MDHDHELDARGALCPIPVLKTKRAMDKLQPGETLKVVSSDPGSVRDMDAFARQMGHELLDSREDGEEFVFFLRKQGPDG